MSNINMDKNNSKKIIPKYMYYLAALSFFGYSFRLLFAYAGNIVGIRYSFAGSLYKVIIAGLIIFMIIKMRYVFITKRNGRFVLCIMLFFAISLGYSLLLNGNILEVDNTGFSVFNYLFFFPFIILLFSSLDDLNELLAVLCVCSKVFSVMFIYIFLITYYRQGRSYDGYDMVLGHQMMYCDIFLLSSYFIKHDLVDLVFIFPVTVISFIVGSRSVGLIIGVFLILIYIRKCKEDSVFRKLFWGLFLMAVLLALFANFDKIVIWISTNLGKYGINTRNILALLDSRTVEESNYARNYIKEKVMGSWSGMPPLGYGILYDRVICNGTYVHNIIYELITDYGFFIGGILIVGISFLSYKLITNDSNVGIVFFSLSIPLLLVSGSYLLSIEFMALIGIYLNLSGNEKSIVQKGDQL